jgi:GAF domain-containing protein
MAKPTGRTAPVRQLADTGIVTVEPAVPQPANGVPPRASRQPANGFHVGLSDGVQYLAGRGQHLPPIGFSVLEEGLEDALSLLHADRGNVQIVDPVTGSLVLVLQTGFSDEFLEYFAVVDDDGSACGRTASQHAQTVISDVNTDPGFAPHREIAAASRFRAVHSTPLVDQSGQLVGVLSTHYPRPYLPPARDLGLMRRLGELIGQAFETSLDADGATAPVSSHQVQANRAAGLLAQYWARRSGPQHHSS